MPRAPVSKDSPKAAARPVNGLTVALGSLIGGSASPSMIDRLAGAFDVIRLELG